MKNFWCEVTLDNIKNNIKKTKELAENKKIIGVVKGNAYGLGIEKISETLDEFVDLFAVADLEEAMRVQSDKDILLLTPMVTLEDFKSDMENIIFTIDNEEILKNLDKEKTYRVHIYLDTGMNRMGIKPENLDNIVEEINNDFPNINIEGIYSHLHNTKNEKYTINQIETFKKTVEKYIDKIPYIHLMNSSGLLKEEIRKKCDFTNGIRVGNIIYGYDGLNVGYKKAYKYLAKPVNKYFVKKGEYIGYGCSYKAKKDMYVGILGFGNIESFGFSKDIKHNIIYDILKVIYNHIKFRPIIFNGNRGIKILGRANMNSTLIDMEGSSLDDILTIDISPILGDSSIKKVYIE